MSVRKYEILSNVYGLRLRCPFRFSARPGATLLEHNVVAVLFHKQGLYMHALRASLPCRDMLGVHNWFRIISELDAFDTCLAKPGLGQGSGPGSRYSSFYFHVTLTVTDTGLVTLTVTLINQQKPWPRPDLQ